MELPWPTSFLMKTIFDLGIVLVLAGTQWEMDL
jgi:hypothetical protein